MASARCLNKAKHSGLSVLKLAIMFGILKMFFFEDFLKTKFHTDEQRIEYVQKELTKLRNNKNYNFQNFLTLTLT